MNMPEYTPPTVEEILEHKRKDAKTDDNYALAEERFKSEQVGGLEVQLKNFDCYKDAEGNNVAHGDDSVRRLVGRGGY